MAQSTPIGAFAAIPISWTGRIDRCLSKYNQR
jgi:hypothetical protein